MAATILITGASGSIGFRILLAALAAGHHVRYTVRSEEKAQKVATNPAMQNLRTQKSFASFSSVIVPDFTVEGALVAAVQGVTHIIHAGSPVPVPTFDPTTQVFEPTVKMSAGLLQSALKSPSVQRVVMTSSMVANVSENVKGPTLASTRIPPPNPLPETFNNVMEAYVVANMLELQDSNAFAEKNSPHFTISYVVPGYVFGRNELALDTTMMQTQNSSNNFLMIGLLGGELPFPIHGAFAHIDDVAEVRLRVAPEEGPGRDVGVATKINYDSTVDAVQSEFPEALKAGVVQEGKDTHAACSL